MKRASRVASNLFFYIVTYIQVCNELSEKDKCRAGLGSVHRLLFGCWDEREFAGVGFKSTKCLDKSCICHQKENSVMILNKHYKITKVQINHMYRQIIHSKINSMQFESRWIWIERIGIGEFLFHLLTSKAGIDYRTFEIIKDFKAVGFIHIFLIIF